ncbi:MAG: lectin like domain-containing protein [Anaerovoracaceae bacterium]
MENLKKILCLVFTAIIVVSLTCSVKASAFSDDDSGDKQFRQELQPAPSGFRLSSIKNLPLNPSSTLLNEILAAENTPPKYDSRDVNGKNYVSSVKNQGSFGTCWAFTAVAVAEADLMRNSKFTETTANMSEIQHAFFTYNRVADPLNLITNDKITLSQGNFLNSGGNNLVSSLVLASWTGMTNETATAPYTYSNVTTSTKIAANKSFGNNAAVLKNAFWILPSDKEAIKRNIMTYGAAGINYYVSGTYYNTDSAAYYNNSVASTNHAVTAVGWNDDYSKTNFLSGKQPSSDGAWLVKNSWGTGWGKAGYFWLSYEDKGLLSSGNYAVILDVDDVHNYTKNYQYDGTAGLSWFSVKDNIYSSNVFEATEDEMLGAVAFMTRNTNVNYEISIYKNPDTDKPNSGTKMTESPKTGAVSYEGYHTVELDKGIKLNKGDKFAVVVKLSKLGSNVMAPIESYSNWGWLINNPKSAAGQSYISTNGTNWTDIGKGDANKNVRVKAFTTSMSEMAKSIKYALHGGTFTTPAQNGYVIGDSFELSKPTRTGYNFGGWYETEDYIGSPVTAITASDQENKTFFAKWNPKKYNIKVVASGVKGGGTIKVSGTEIITEKTFAVEFGTYLDLEAITEPGYYFWHWTDIRGAFRSVEKNYSHFVNESIEVHAVFVKEASTCVVETQSSGGGTASVTAPSLYGKYQFGTNVEVIADNDAGNNFVNWTNQYGQVVSTYETYSFRAVVDSILTANFVGNDKPSLSLKASPQFGGVVNDDTSVDAGHGESKIIAIPSEGYVFDYWTVDGEEKPGDITMKALIKVNYDRGTEVMAYFKEAPLISVNKTGVGTVAEKIFFEDEKEYREVTATPAEGYRFDCWKLNGVKVSSTYRYSFECNVNKNVVADFLKIGTASITIKKSGKNAASVSWAKVPGAEKYLIYNKQGSGAWKYVGATSSASFLSKNLARKKSYSYRVQVQCNTGEKITKGSFSGIKTIKIK